MLFWYYSKEKNAGMECWNQYRELQENSLRYWVTVKWKALVDLPIIFVELDLVIWEKLTDL